MLRRGFVLGSPNLALLVIWVKRGTLPYPPREENSQDSSLKTRKEDHFFVHEVGVDNINIRLEGAIVPRRPTVSAKQRDWMM